jgi:preprotein translocase subunit SecG
MQTVILVLHVLAAAAVIGLVLLQHGKGADMGAASGGGSAGSLFGATGSANFLSRATAVIATVFFATSLGLTYLSTGRSDSKGVILGAPPATSDQALPSATPPVSPADADSKAKEIPK